MAETTSSNPTDTADATQMVQDAMAQAENSLRDLQQATQTADTETQRDQAVPMDVPVLDNPGLPEQAVNPIDLLGDVDLNVTIELGRTKMLVEDVLRLGGGSVVELDKLAGDPVDVYVNQRLVARGEVLVLNDNFCIRISEIVADLKDQATAAAEQELTGG